MHTHTHTPLHIHVCKTCIHHTQLPIVSSIALRLSVMPPRLSDARHPASSFQSLIATRHSFFRPQIHCYEAIWVRFRARRDNRRVWDSCQAANGSPAALNADKWSETARRGGTCLASCLLQTLSNGQGRGKDWGADPSQRKVTHRWSPHICHRLNQVLTSEKLIGCGAGACYDDSCNFRNLYRGFKQYT